MEHHKFYEHRMSTSALSMLHLPAASLLISTGLSKPRPASERSLGLSGAPMGGHAARDGQRLEAPRVCPPTPRAASSHLAPGAASKRPASGCTMSMSMKLVMLDTEAYYEGEARVSCIVHFRFFVCSSFMFLRFFETLTEKRYDRLETI